jgi:glucose/mannose-6-phosphate isomerase
MRTETPMSLVFMGVGGSGIVGDILTDYCRDAVGIPVMVCRSLKIPKFVGKDTLVVAISYSGETRETLDMFEEARHSGARLAAVCSGGKLLDAARTLGVPYVKVTAGMLPRVALPELVGAAIHVLAAVGILEDTHRLLDMATSSTRALIDEVKATVPLERNPAKQVATALMGRLPLLIGSEENISVLRRFKNELNENSKVPAVFYTLPEAYHDDIEGLKALCELSQPQPVILRSHIQAERELRTGERLLQVLSQLHFPTPASFSGLGDGRLEWLLSAIAFGDFVSVYLSALRGVDPSEMSLIPSFRAITSRV